MIIFLMFLTDLLYAQEGSTNYNVSVFNRTRHIVSSERHHSMEALQKVKQHFPGMNATIDPINGGVTDIFGEAITVSGNSIESKIQSIWI